MGRSLRFVLEIAAALSVVLPLGAGAEEEISWYAVEIIVFERTSEIGRDAEAWPAAPGLPDLAGSVELSVEGLSPEELARGPAPESDDEPPAETVDEPPASTDSVVLTPLNPLPRAFQLVAAEEYRLTDMWESLDRSSAFRPLLHVAWIQPGYPSEEARLVHVRNGNAALGTVPVSVDEETETAPPSEDLGFAPTLSPRITVARDPSKVAIDGTLRMHRARYLHVEADLLYYRPLDGDAGGVPVSGEDPDAAPVLDSPDTALIEQLLAEDDQAPRLFRLTESRRMRSRELHYLDHPLFGMLVEVWPVELPEEPEETLPVLEDEAPAVEGDATQPASAQSGGG